MSGNKKLDDLLIDSSSPEQSKEDIQKYLEKKQAAYDELEASAPPLERARLQLDVAEALVGSGRADESWEKAVMCYIRVHSRLRSLPWPMVSGYQSPIRSILH